MIQTPHLARILDGAAFIAMGGALAHILPPLAAGLSVIWLAIQIGMWVKKKGWK